MNSQQKLSLEYKQKIDKKIKNLPPNINRVYGGQTEHTLVKRQKQHERDNVDFRDMEIIKVFSSARENKVKQINLAETYLIQQLRKHFVGKCLNIAQNGGGGQHHNEGDNHKIYIMYK